MGIEDLFNELGIDSSAGPDEIKRAYRQAAMQHHPDKNPGDKQAEEKFKKISEAHDILMDPEKRSAYENNGNLEGMMNGMPDMNDIFGGMFGGMFSGGGFGRQQQHHRETDEMSCGLSLQEVHTGIVQQMGPLVIQTNCHACFGNCSGSKSGKACTTCKGKKVVRGNKTLKIEVPRGIPDGFKSTLKGKGNYENGKHNDLDITFVYQKASNIAVDKNSNIETQIDIGLEDLLCGFRKTVNYYGTPINLSSTGYFNPDNKVVYKQKGLAKYKGKHDACGDLVIKYNIVYQNDERYEKYIDVFLKVFKREKII